MAMGKGGTEITRDAADLILLDDNFSVLVTSIAQGRLMVLNVSLFIIYLLSCNSAEIWTVLLAILMGWPTPLTPLAILWANIIADIPPSMCLALEVAPEEQLMRDKPRDVLKRILGPHTWILVLVNGFLLAAITLIVFHWTTPGQPLEVKRSEAFLVLIGMQIVLALFSRSTHQSVFRVGLFGNLWLFLAVLISFGLLVMGLYVPWLNERLGLTPVGGLAWIKFAISLSVMILGNEATKFVLRLCVK